MYFYMQTDELMKNHQTDVNTASSRMYSRDNKYTWFVSYSYKLKVNQVTI